MGWLNKYSGTTTTDTTIPNLFINTKTPKTENKKESGFSDEELLKQAWKESSFRPEVKNSLGYMGLAQVGNAAISDYKKAHNLKTFDPYDPSSAKKIQRWYMDKAYNSGLVTNPTQTEENRKLKALAYYNYGPGNLKKVLREAKSKNIDTYNSDKWLDLLPQETREYGNKILGKDEKFNKEYDSVRALPKYNKIVETYVPKAQEGRKQKNEKNASSKVRDNIPQQNKFQFKPRSQKLIDSINKQEEIEKTGEIKQYESQSTFNRLKEVALNPVTAFGYAARNQVLPENFSRGERNPVDYAVDVINPAQYLHDATNVVEGTAAGDLGQIGEGVLGVVPLALEAKNMAKGFSKLKNKAVDKYQDLNELNTFDPKSIYHNQIRGQIKGDVEGLSLFKRPYVEKYGKKLANKKIAEEVDNIINNVKPGNQLREKSLSTDSYRLLLHKAGTLKDDFELIPTNSYQSLNGAGALRNKLWDKHVKPVNEFIKEGTSFKFGEGQYESILDGLYTKMGNNIEKDMLSKLQAYTDRLSRQTGKSIKPVKLVDNEILVPQLIMERKGTTPLKEINRYSSFLKTAGAAGVGGFGIDSNLGLFDGYDSMLEKYQKRQDKKDMEEWKNSQIGKNKTFKTGGKIKNKGLDKAQEGRKERFSKIDPSKIYTPEEQKQLVRKNKIKEKTALLKNNLAEAQNRKAFNQSNETARLETLRDRFYKAQEHPLWYLPGSISPFGAVEDLAITGLGMGFKYLKGLNSAKKFLKPKAINKSHDAIPKSEQKLYYDQEVPETIKRAIRDQKVGNSPGSKAIQKEANKIKEALDNGEEWKFPNGKQRLKDLQDEYVKRADLEYQLNLIPVKDKSGVYTTFSKTELGRFANSADMNFSSKNRRFRSGGGGESLDYSIDYFNRVYGTNTFDSNITRFDDFKNVDEANNALNTELDEYLSDQFFNGFESPSRIDYGDVLTSNSNGGKIKKKWLKKYQNGGKVIEDNRGQWAHPGEVTKINSNNITMKGVNYPVLGVSDTGDTQMMYPNGEYQYDGKSVTEYPMAQDGKTIKLNEVSLKGKSSKRKTTKEYKNYLESVKKYNDSLYAFDKQNELNSQYLSNYETVPESNYNGLDLNMKALYEQSKEGVNNHLSTKEKRDKTKTASKKAINEEIVKANRSRNTNPQTQVRSPYGDRDRFRNRTNVLHSGNIPSKNKDANYKTPLDVIFSDDTVDLPQQQHNVTLGGIKTTTPYKTSKRAWRPGDLFLDEDKTKFYERQGYPYQEVVDDEIKPIGSMDYFQTIPIDSSVAQNVDPSSYDYDANQMLEVSLPFYKKPTTPIPPFTGDMFEDGDIQEFNSTSRKKIQPVGLNSKGLRTSQLNPESKFAGLEPEIDYWDVVEEVNQNFGGNKRTKKVYKQDEIDRIKRKQAADEKSSTGKNNRISIKPRIKGWLEKYNK